MATDEIFTPLPKKYKIREEDHDTLQLQCWTKKQTNKKTILNMKENQGILILRTYA